MSTINQKAKEALLSKYSEKAAEAGLTAESSWDDIISVTEAGVDEIATVLQDAYDEYSTNLEDAVKLDWAKIRTDYESGVNSILELEESNAEKVRQTWENVWNTIKTLREAALSGELKTKTIGEIINDPQQL